MPSSVTKDKGLLKGEFTECGNPTQGKRSGKPQAVITKGQVLKQAKKSNELHQKTLEKPVAVGRWTDEEHNLFLEGLQKFPYRAWKKIATLIQTRTVVQIRTHAQKYYQKLQKEESCRSQNCISHSETNNCLKCNLSPRSSHRKKSDVLRGRKRKIENQSNREKKNLRNKVKLVFRLPSKEYGSSVEENSKQNTATNIPDDKCLSIQQKSGPCVDDPEQFPMLESLPLIDDNAIELVKSIAPVDDLMFLQLYSSEDDVSYLSDEGSFGWLHGTDDEQDHDSLSLVFSSPASPFSEFSSTESCSSNSICLTPLYSKFRGDVDNVDFCPVLDEDPLLDPDIFVTDFFTSP